MREKQVNNFAQIHSNWQFVLPPSRPSIQELERIKTLLINCDREKPIAILGSTIEFRNLLHFLGFHQIYVFEKNRSFYSWTSSWVTHDVELEQVVWGDWLQTIMKYKNYFQAVLSDLTSGNVPYNDRKIFYQAIYESLVDGGVFIDKVLTHCIPHDPLDELMKKYEQTPINLQTVNRFSCEVLFCSTLLNDGVVDTSYIYNILTERYTSPTLRKYIEKAQMITPNNCMWYYGRTWDELEVHYLVGYSQRVSFEDVPDSPYFGRCKQFIHTK